jgi:hypothetical protein
MGLRFLYTEAMGKELMIYEEFADNISEFPEDISEEIMNKVMLSIDDLPNEDLYVQQVSGVVELDERFFYEIDYFKEKNGIPILLDIREILLDDYLDSIIKQRHFK